MPLHKMILVPLLLLASTLERPFEDERSLLDRRLETLRRILPDGPRPAIDMAVVKELADAAHLMQPDIAARPPLESGSRGEVVVEVSAVARYADVERFFRQVALSHRLIDVVSLTLTANPDDSVKLATVLRFPYRPVKAPLPAPPDGTRARVSGVARPQADAFIRDQALVVAKSEQIAALRRARRNPRLFLSELAAIVRDRPVVLSHASLGDESASPAVPFVVRGFAVGEGPVRALESRFERGFFRVGEFLMARQGGCRRFEVRGVSPIVGPEAELPLPTDDPFEQDDTPCRVDRDTARGTAIRAPNSKTPGKGPLTLRLRDVDLADVFLVLHQVTGQGFLVDGDVVGRTSLDLARVTLDEILAALEKGAGLKVSETGTVRRVSLGRAGSSRAPVPTVSAPASFTLKRADVRDILAVMSEVDPSLAALGPQGPLGRVSLWAKDVAVADLRAGVLESAGLTERFEEGRRILEQRPGSDETVAPVAGAPPDPRLALRPQDLALLEFDLAGVAGTGDQWVALAYSPSGALNVYATGARLSDALVRSVDSTDAVLDTDDGPVRFVLAPMR